MTHAATGPFGSESELQWLGGFFDARGQIRIERHQRQHVLAVQFSGTPDVLDCIKTILGLPKILLNHTGTTTTMTVYGQRAGMVLHLLAPYLRVKRYLADLGMTFQASVNISAAARGYRAGSAYRLQPQQVRDREETRKRLKTATKDVRKATLRIVGGKLESQIGKT